MIRTDTTLIIGAGANREIEMPDGADLLGKIAAGFEFERLDSEVKSRDLVNFAHLFQQISGEVGLTYDELVAGASAIREATLVTNNIDAILEQYGHDNADDVVATGVTFMLATSVHYVFGRTWIFSGTDRKVAKGFAIFLINAMVGLALTVGLFWLMTEYTPINYLVVRVIVSIFAGLAVFGLNAVFNFRQL